MNAQASQYSQIISRTLYSSRVDLDVTRLEGQIRENVRSLVYSLGPYNIAFATITTNGPKLDSLISGLEGKIENLRASLANISQKLSIVNGVQNINGGASFQLSDAILDTTSSADAQTNDLFDSLSTCSTNGQNFTALIQNSDLYSESNVFISSGFLLSNWTDIQSTIHAKLARNAAQVSSDVNPILEESMGRVLNISDKTSTRLNETAAVFRTTVDKVGFMGFKGSDQTRSLLLNLFWSIYTSVTLALIILIFAILTLIAAVFYGDVCQSLTDHDTAYLSGLDLQTATTASTIFGAAQSNCINQDPSKMAALSKNASEDAFTNFLPPLLTSLNLSRLHAFTETDLIPMDITSLQNHSINDIGTTLVDGMCPLILTRLDTGAADDMRNAISVVASDLSNHQGGDAISGQVYTVLDGSVTYTQLFDGWQPLLNDVQSLIDVWEQTLVSINADVTQIQILYSQFGDAASRLSTPIPDDLVSSYSNTSIALKEFIPYATHALSLQVSNLTKAITAAVDSAQTILESNVSCSRFGDETGAFQAALCQAFLDPLDSLFTSFCFAGIASAILVFMFPWILRTVDTQKRAKMIEASIEQGGDIPKEKEVIKQHLPEQTLVDEEDDLPTPSLTPPATPPPVSRSTVASRQRIEDYPAFHATLPNSASEFTL
ncbi:hypothetical protein HDU81_008034 [Chytriomyces hyalinus]|nr:hypothetical protein HDU81_008034 [Chytriomyces hyalinus]